MNAWLHFKTNTDKVTLSWPMKTQLHQPASQKTVTEFAVTTPVCPTK
jgi:hypothetical protein